MSLVLLGSTSGSVTLQEPAIAGSTVIDLPATSGTMAVLPTATSVLPEASGGTGTTTGYYGFKNRIINGAMVIDQRNAGASVTPTNAQYLVDRWMARLSQSSKFSVQQNAGSVTPPVGFTNYLGATSLSAYSVTSTDEFGIRQRIEGFNVADFGWGAAGAATITLSFWVRSSLTGTFGGALQNGAGNRSYPFSYTVSAANTWEQKAVTIAGDTSGTWLTTNGIGIEAFFSLGAGSTVSGTAGAWTASGLISATGATSVVGTNGATFYLTGVQLEKGSTATSFDYRPYGTELALCQRYCINYKSANANGLYYRYSYGECVAATVFNGGIQFPATMRITPSVTTIAAANYAIYSKGIVTTASAVPFIGADGSSNINLNISCDVASGLTQGSGGSLVSNNNQTSYLLFSSEL
jgi:hypothetical protein